ncbi:MAG: hypothetical protein ABIJ00_14700 [Candidatus Eisenbacteria bacterium]
MRLRNEAIAGVVAGLLMGLALFVGGAIASRIIYGPQFAPDGKFEPSELNPLYFLWTKLAIGGVLGLMLSLIYASMPLTKRLDTVVGGLKHGFLLWFVIWLWKISHPLVYGPIGGRDQLFWLVYSLSGFLGLGAAFGLMRKRLSR